MSAVFLSTSRLVPTSILGLHVVLHFKEQTHMSVKTSSPKAYILCSQPRVFTIMFTILVSLSQRHDDFPFLAAKMPMYMSVLKYRIIKFDARGEHFKISSAFYIHRDDFIEKVFFFSPIYLSLTRMSLGWPYKAWFIVSLS